jgi:uncharacterized membrane protein SpoIIM required for sporulation
LIMAPRFWNNTSPRRKRLMTIVLVFIVSAIMMGISTLTPLSRQSADSIYNELNQTVSTGKDSGNLLQYIFGNNLMITIMMLIPFIGPFLGFYAFYNTGVAIAATSIVKSYPPLVAYVSLWLTPVAWLEFAAYSTAITASLWLTWRIMHQGARHELVNTSKFLSVCTLILLLGAIIETVIV